MNSSKFYIEVYTEINKIEWDNFVLNSKNATFLHTTEYMDYNRKRFKDYSLIIRYKKNNKIFALIPGNIEGNGIFNSYAGLTYGGLLLSSSAKLVDVLDCFTLINEFLIRKKIRKVIYKAIPFIYMKAPSQEDEYCLFRIGAKRISAGASSVIDMRYPIEMSTMRKRNLKKIDVEQMKIIEDLGYEEFWAILSDNLNEKYRKDPVHNLEEILFLKSKFPNQIKLYSVTNEGKTVAGAVMYITDKVAHVQYIATNSLGKEIFALDYLFDYLITKVFVDFDFFDFGISVEDNGNYLNVGLNRQKEQFGARTVLYNVYEYSLEEGFKL